ncbi:methyltransferase [Actinoplanes sp. NPDC051470]|uniref:methyltransferase n=1 Tax=Actinoplanes sp. NPDC051470 TaxID=3157224 RepID=UPI0034212D94
MSEYSPQPAPPITAVMTQMLAGFQVSQALYVVAKLDICTMLDDGPQTTAKLAELSGAQVRPLSRIIRTLSMLGLFRSEGDLVETTPLGATLSRNHPETLCNVAEMWMETHYAPFGELLHTVRTGEPAAQRFFGQSLFDWIGEDEGRTAQFAQAMTDVTGSMRKGLFDGYELPAGELVADIGGSDGSVLAELIGNRPERRGIVFDQPAVVPVATEAMTVRRMADRVKVIGGDFFQEVPAADVYLLSMILHDWDDDSAVKLLHTIRRSADAARLVIVEGVVPADDAPHPMKLIDLTMLGITRGWERTADEFAELLAAGGYQLDRIIDRPSPFSIIEATAR